jgi:hypothetical protein
MVHDQNGQSLLTEFIGVFAINAPDENVSHPGIHGVRALAISSSMFAIL